MLHGGRDRLWTMTVMSMAVAAVCLVAIPFLPAPHPASWPYILASGLLELGYNLFLVRAYRLGALGETYPIARGTSPVLVTLGAALFAAELLGPVTLLGIGLISTGIVALAFGRGQPQNKGLGAALATGCFIAAYTVVDGIGVRLAGDNFAYTAWRYLFWGIPMPFILVALRGSDAFRAPGSEFVRAALGGLVAMAAYGAIIWALQLGSMGPISALRELSVVFAVLIAHFFMKERLTPRRLAACCLIALGAALLGYRG